MLLIANPDGDVGTQSFRPLVRLVDIVDVNGDHDARQSRRPSPASEELRNDANDFHHRSSSLVPHIARTLDLAIGERHQDPAAFENLL
jgi:hypothetical protein